MSKNDKAPGEIIKTRQILPKANKTMAGFKRMGYTPQSALADLIDNSIAAGATVVHIIHTPKFNSQSVVYIADNGCGMDYKTLEIAMGYGSDDDIANSKLSVYGLGMKTASTSFSPKFSVLSRTKNGIENCMSWDLERQSENPWGLDDIVPTKSHLEMLNKVAGKSSGTVVMWDSAQLKLADPIQRQTLDNEKMIERIDDNIKEHLRLVFHRIMSGDSKRYQKVDIYFNNQLLEPWNPFAQEYLLESWFHPEESFTHEFFDIDGTRIRGNYSLQAYLLNPESENRENAHKESRFELNFQGFYTYREDRLIDRPNWLSFRTTRHNSLNALRFKFEIDASLDPELELTVKKDQIVLPQDMWGNLRPIYMKFANEAEDRNRKRRKAKKVSITPDNLHDASSKTIYKHRDDIPMPTVERVSRTDVRVENQYGSNVIRIRDISQPSRPENFVIPVDQLDDGVLYEPLFNGRDITIQINKSHDFYQKIYLAFFDNPLAIEALDNVLWAFARAELNAATNIRTQFVEMRTLVSSYLRLYAEEKLDPDFLNNTEFDEDAN